MKTKKNNCKVPLELYKKCMSACEKEDYKKCSKNKFILIKCLAKTKQTYMSGP